jgi:hypothetical protein
MFVKNVSQVRTATAIAMSENCIATVDPRTARFLGSVRKNKSC